MRLHTLNITLLAGLSFLLGSEPCIPEESPISGIPVSIHTWGNPENQASLPVPNTLDVYQEVISNEWGWTGLKADGTINGWGTPALVNTQPFEAPSDGGYIAIVSNAQAFAALKEADGSISAWGSPDYGGTGAPGDGGYTRIVSAEAAFAALKEDGSISVWGSLTRHTGTDSLSEAATFAPSDTGYIDLYSTGYMMVALREDGSITVWTHDSKDQVDAPVSTGPDWEAYVWALRGEGNVTYNVVNVGGSLEASLLYGIWDGSIDIVLTEGDSQFNNESFAIRRQNGSIFTWEVEGYEGTHAPSDGGYKALYSNGHAFAALREDGSISAWGRPGWGGTGAPSDTGYTKIVSAGAGFAALKADGSISAWGIRFEGSTSTGYTAIDLSTGAPSDKGYTHIVSTSGALAALHEDGSIFAWGGTDAPYGRDFIWILPGIGSFTAFRAADEEPPVITLAGPAELTVDICLGFNDPGASATDNQDAEVSVEVTGNIPEGVPGVYTLDYSAMDSQGNVATVSRKVVMVDAQANILPNKVTSWGNAQKGGSGAPEDTGYVSVVATYQAFAGLKANGAIHTWGHPSYGGSGGPTDCGFVGLYSNDRAFVAMRQDGSLEAWGDYYNGGGQNKPLTSDTGYEKIFTSNRSSDKSAFVAMKGDGSIKAWGEYGALGTPTDTGYERIFFTGHAFAALKADGSISAWGSVQHGGTNAPTDSGYVDIIASSAAFVALHEDGSIKAWGAKGWGGTDAPSNDNQFTQVVASDGAFAALREDGTVVNWGHRSYGGNHENKLPPSGDGYEKLFAHGSAFAALHEDGSIFAWGGSYASEYPKDNPGYTHIVSNGSAFAALHEDGVKAWGDGHRGGGVNSNPVPEMSGGYQEIFTNDGGFAAMKHDGSITFWGMWGTANTAPGYVDVIANPSTFVALKQDGTVFVHGDPNRGATGAPTDGGYDTIIPSDHAFAALKGPLHVAGNEDTLLAGTLSGSSFTISRDPMHGTAVIDPTSGVWSYTPDDHFHGLDVFEVSFTDELGEPASLEVYLVVHPVNDLAVFSGDIQGEGNEDTTLVGTLQATDLDGLTDGTLFTLTTTAAHGTAVIDPASGAWSYIPNPDFHGQDNFEVTLTDDLGGQQGREITLTVHPVNDLAVFSEDIQGEGNEDTTLGGTLQATDPDGLTDGTLFTLTAQAAHGIAAIDPAAGVWSYTPNLDFHGPDSFEVTLTDDLGGQQSREITLTIHPLNDPPVISGAGLPRKYHIGENIPVVDTSLDIGDVDDIYLESATLSLSGNGVPSGDVLTFSGVGLAILGSVDTPGRAYGVVLSSDGNTAYVADHDAGLQVIDVSDLAILGSIDTPGDARGVALSGNGNIAYVAAITGGLEVIDVTDPAEPFLKRRFNSVIDQGIFLFDDPDVTRIYPRRVALSSDGNTAFVTTGDGLQGIDLTDLADSDLWRVNMPGPAYGVTLSSDGNTAFVADGSAGLQIIDVDDVPNLYAFSDQKRILGSVDTPGSAQGVALSTDGNTAFVADGSAGLQIIDVTDPATPAILGSVDTPGLASGVALSTDGTTAFVADYAAGLQVIDVNLGNPIVASWDADLATLTLSGRATLDQYRRALLSVRYHHTSPDPVTGDRTVTIVVEDGGGASSIPVTSTILMNPLEHIVISGRVTLFGDGQTPVPGTRVQVDVDNESHEIQTGEDGYYQVTLTPGDTYALRADLKTDTNANQGVDVRDIIQLRKHILNREKLSNPMAWLAADTNLDTSIDVLDIVAIRKVILSRTSFYSTDANGEAEDMFRFTRLDFKDVDPLLSFTSLPEALSMNYQSAVSYTHLTLPTSDLV